MRHLRLLKTVSRIPKQTIIKTSLSTLTESSPSAVGHCQDMVITTNFITSREEAAIMKELKLTFRRKYEYSHWDEVYNTVTQLLHVSLLGYHWIQRDREEHLGGARESASGGTTTRRNKDYSRGQSARDTPPCARTRSCS